MISALQHKSKYKSNSISNFLEKKIKFSGSYVVVLVKTFPLTYQLATNVGLILTKTGRFFLGIQKLGVRTEFHIINFELFEKFSHFWVSMVQYS